MITSCFNNFPIWNPDWSQWWSGPWVPCELVSTGSWLGSGSWAWASSGLTLSSIAERHYFSNRISIIKKEQRFNGEYNSQRVLQIPKRIVFSAEALWNPSRRCQWVFPLDVPCMYLVNCIEAYKKDLTCLRCLKVLHPWSIAFRV